MIQQCLVQILTFYLISVTLAFHETLAKTEAFAANSSSECCSACIGKTSDVTTSHDPLIVSQCTNVTGGNCCFDCGNLRDPIYGDTVSYGVDGVTAVAKTGTYISFAWTGIESVTYVSLEAGQTKTVSQTVSNIVATKESDTFVICAKSAGTIYFRGWGSDICKEASPEHSITIEAGDSSSTTCDANDVKMTTPSSSDGSSVAADETVETCSQERASILTVDGMETCVCVSGWTNPPECDHWPLWKWLMTIGGAVAALVVILSISFSFVQKRKKKQEEEICYSNLASKKHEHEGYRENLAPMGTKSDLGPLDYTPESGYHDDPTMTTFTKETERTPGGTGKPDERLFSL
ncbi:unnamed protein product [Peronospora destructor]|uniref:Uncharacterized protein n=1 Tax=Peronospora destructor TaxID=86335 RepID=A0AAV0SVV9_9STRA|nr:unnamed protein product [Peronospora destructor]